MGIITSNGVNLPTLVEITIDNTDLWSELTGEVDVSASSASGELIAINSEMQTLYVQDIADAVAANQIENASGVNLDYIARIKNQERKANQQTVAYIEIVSTGDVTIPQGTNFICSDNDEIFTLDYEVKIVFSASDTAYASVTSENIGISASANSISLETPISGVTVTNNRTAFQGFEEETNAELRNRLLRLGTPTSYNLKVGLELALLQLDNVKSVNILDNNTLSTVQGVNPKSFSTIVLGGNRAEIADVIHKYSGCGSASFGDIQQLVKAEDGNIYPVNFSEPTELLTVVNASLTTNSDFDEDSGKEQIRDLIIEYFDGLTIGDDLFIQIVESICLIDGVTNVVLTLDGGSVSLFAGYDEIFVTNQANVAVTN